MSQGDPREDEFEELTRLRRHCADLEMRLEESEEILSAIRKGEVDALLVNTEQGDQIYTLKSADLPYRVIIENMQEGAATLANNGTVLYGNRRFSELLDKPLNRLIGDSFPDYVFEEDRSAFDDLITRARTQGVREELRLKSHSNDPFPVLFSAAPLRVDGLEAICLVITDLSELRAVEKVNYSLRGEIERRTQVERELRDSQGRLQALSETLERRVLVRTQELRRLAGYLETVREDEGRRIAQEIHDQIGGGLTAVKIDLSLMRRALADRPSLEKKLEALIQIVDSVIHDVRRVSRDLRPPVLDQLGFGAAVQSHVGDYELRTGITAHLDLRAPDPLDNSQAMSIFRIVQESLTNVAKHSGATRVTVRTEVIEDQFRLEIEDNGKGIDLSAREAGTIGLIGMEERASRVGGQLAIDRLDSGGTRISLSIPLSAVRLGVPPI